MPLGPVFRHEMLAAGRKRRYMVLRVFVGAILLALLAMGYMAANAFVVFDGGAASPEGGLSIAAVSRLTAQFYASFAWWTLLGVLFITPAIAAGAIATERERRTIEYLFATDLSNSEIVLDKLVARLLTVGQIVLAAFPLLAIFRLLGGVPGDLVLIHFATLASTATLVAAISIAVSTWCERARDAVPRAYGRVFLLFFAPVILQGFHWFINLAVPSTGPLSGAVDWFTLWILGPLVKALLIINPIHMLGTAAGISGGVLGVDLDLPVIGRMIAGQLLLAAACLALSIFAIRRVHLNAAGPTDSPKKQASHSRKSFSPWENNPLLWKELRFGSTASAKINPWRRRVGEGLAVLCFVIMIGANLWLAITSSRADGWEEYFQFAAIMIGFLGPIILLLLGCRAAGLITYEKERETWLSLLATPLSAEEILFGKLLGNLGAYRWALLAIVIVPATGMIVRPGAFLAALGVLLTTVVVGWAVTAVGLLISLWCKSSVKAIGITIGVLVGIGGGYLPFAFPFVMMLGIHGDEATLLFASCVPFLFVAPIISQFDIGDASFLATYVIGILGYAILAFLATGLALARLNRTE